MLAAPANIERSQDNELLYPDSMKPDGTPYFCRRIDRERHKHSCYCMCSREEEHDAELRGKFACFTCRRTFRFKQVPNKEYRMGPGGVRYVRPDRNHMKEVCTRNRPLRYTDPARWAELERQNYEIYAAFFNGQGTVPPQEELDALKPYAPDAWWTRVDPLCPGCGAAGVSVPDAFEAPPQKDVKEWKAAQEWLARRPEELASLRKLEEGGLRLTHYRARKRQEELEPERRRRVETLRKAVELGVRTSEEERRLAVIRARKGGPAVDKDAWAVVICPEVFVTE